VSAALLLLAALLFRPCLWADDSKDQTPSFTPDSIVNAANGSPDSLTPNVIASLYGRNLAFSTAEVSLDDVGFGTLPKRLAGVQLIVGGIVAPLLYVSPTQINFVVPANLIAGQVSLVVERQGTSAQTRISLLEAAPALFLVLDGKLAAEHADGRLITAELPARPGEIIVIFATGLGRTNPRQLDGVIPRAAAPIVLRDRLRILLDGEILPDKNLEYAGITPGYPGLYQINLRLPNVIAKKDPELRALLDEQSSQTAVSLQVAWDEPQTEP
jgi:uncharacterized protein (TIGR03437 family)